MNNGSKPTYVEPEGKNSATALDEAPDETLAAKALEDIRSTERLSGLGRFAAKMQNLFQGSDPSQTTKQQASRLKAAPILMCAGLLLLLATGLLFLLSKPESAVHSHFRQPTGLSGTENYKSAAGANGSDTAVTENQLAGRDVNTEQQKSNRSKADSGANRDEVSSRKYSFDDGAGGSTTPAGLPNQAGSNELQNPATVFVANTQSSPVLASAPRSASQPEVQIPSGAEIVAHTTNAISSGLESPVIAIVDRNVQVGGAVVIPQGARVIGYTAGAVKDRINVRFTSLIFPNDREVTISGLALMKDGSAGLVGKVRGSGHPVLATAARIGTGAAVVATEFTGAGSLNQPFSQADYLRNQMGYEISSEGNRYSSRLQQPTSIPIVTVNTNQPIRIFLLSTLPISQTHNSKRAQADTINTPSADQNQSPEQALVAAQTAYIQSLETQLAEMRAALDGKKTNGHN
jgi:hypothetical protein